MYGTSDWCFCTGLASIPRVTYSHPDTEDILRDCDFVENGNVDWELIAELDALEEDFAF